MRVSYEWLKSMLDLPQDPQDLVREYVRTGTEVEGVETVGANLDKVVTAKILTKVPHPDSDHMYVTTVDVGKHNVDDQGNPVPLQVVCGAQNFEAGDHVVTALVGAVLPGDFKIKKAKKRGIESCGMNCSEVELGLSAESAGIMILPDDAPIGMPIAEYLGSSDTVLDCEITPNRPDCLSMMGMAVETSAILDEDTHIELPKVQVEKGAPAADVVDVKIDDPELCYRYTARVVRNVKIGPSPEWLAKRVIAAGSRSINNVVDVTNYVMYLTGQPLHAFDLGKLSERDGLRHIVVRAAHEGEKLTTLDEVERTLTPDMAVITDDGNRTIALAGVMGGANSDIDENTTDVLLESASFSAGHISRTSRNLDLMSEASIRYERGVDRTQCARVADIAAALFESCCGAEVAPGIVDVYPAPFEAPTLTLRPERACALAGADIPTEFMATRLTRLGCTVAQENGKLQVTVPTNRPDLEREVDLIEEVVRLWGEGDITPTLPAAKNHAGGLTHEQKLARKIGRILRAQGLSETTTYCYAAPADLTKLNMSETGRGVPVEILRPLIADESEMRRTLLSGLLESVAYNLDHGVENVALYEQGRVFFGREGQAQPDEPVYVSGVLCGARSEKTWAQDDRPYDFFDLKGVIEELLDQLRITKVRFRVADPEQYGWLQPGAAAEVLSGGTVLGWLGVVHPKSAQNFGVDKLTLAFELNQAQLIRLAHDELPYEDIPTLPGVSIDIALVVDEDATAEMLMQRIKSAGGKLLSDIRLFDVFRDPVKVGPHKKSMAFALTYRAADRTLTSEEVEKAHSKLVAKVAKSTGAEVRS